MKAKTKTKRLSEENREPPQKKKKEKSKRSHKKHKHKKNRGISPLLYSLSNKLPH